MINRVYTAEPYRDMAMGSFGDARYMLLRQSKFPDTYSDEDIMASMDHDRLINQDYDHWGECIKKTAKARGKRGLENWFQNGKVKDLLEFLIDVLKADKKIKWTGFRILGTVNCSNGYPVYSLQIFAKTTGTKTKVYSNENAPNVNHPAFPEGIKIVRCWR